MNRQFTEEESRIDKHTKRCSTLVIIRDIKIKIRNHFTLIILENFRVPENSKCWLRYKGMKAVIRCWFSSVQFSSVAQSCPNLCNPMNRSTPGLPVHHKLPEFTQTHVHRVSDAIQPSHPLSSPSPPAPNPSQHQSLFQ